MKSPLKHIATLFVIIALAAVMVTFFTACKDDPGDDKPTSGTGFYEGFEYSYDATGVTITDYAGREVNVVIPAEIDGKPVISIGDKAFYGGDESRPGNVKLTSVTIPSSVKSIGEWAFSNNKLTSVTIPDSVTSIGKAAFQNNQLTSVTIPDSVTSIGDVAFSANRLTSVTIGNGVISIGEAAFRGTQGLDDNELTSITIPNSVTFIGAYAFRENKLTSVTIGSGVTSIGEGAFAYNKLTEFSLASGNTAYMVHESLLLSKDGKQLLMYYGSETTVTIPASVTSIVAHAFNAVNDNRLTSVTFATSSITSIGEWAFGNNQLASVTIPDSVTSIGAYAFTGNKLTSVTIGSGVIFIGGWAFSDGELASITIGANVTTINPYAFSEFGSEQSSSFVGTYTTTNKAAGTYTRSGTAGNYTWTKTP